MMYLLFLVIGYILGSFPTAYIVVKYVTGKDVRFEETGNVGAMNTARVTGKWYLFLVVFLLDALKGFLAVFIPFYLSTFIVDPGYALPTAYLVSAFGAVAGHCWSSFFWLKDGKFAGGKAVSTMAGIILFLSFMKLFIPICIFMLLVVALTRNFFASQFFGALALPFVALIFIPQYFLLCLLCVIPILIKQSPRVIPFFQGKEPLLYFKPASKIKKA